MDDISDKLQNMWHDLDKATDAMFDVAQSEEDKRLITSSYRSITDELATLIAIANKQENE